jgi:hypothetical protein
VQARLTGASLLTFSGGGATVSAHRLVMRIVRERQVRRGDWPRLIISTAELLEVVARSLNPCDLGVIARVPVAQLDPAHGARLFKCDRSCWKSGLRAARLTNAYQRRPSAPPRKMTADPVHCGGQTVPVHISAFSRHVSIMRLLPLGYEHYDARLAGLRRSGASR